MNAVIARAKLENIFEDDFVRIALLSEEKRVLPVHSVFSDDILF